MNWARCVEFREQFLGVRNKVDRTLLYAFRCGLDVRLSFLFVPRTRPGGGVQSRAHCGGAFRPYGIIPVPNLRINIFPMLTTLFETWERVLPIFHAFLHPRLSTGMRWCMPYEPTQALRRPRGSQTGGYILSMGTTRFPSHRA